MTTRLHTKYPALAHRILGLSESSRDCLVKVAARAVLESAALEPELTRAVLATIDGNASLDEATKARLEALLDELDEVCLGAHDAVESHRQLPDAELPAFFKARALAAILGALEVTDNAGAAEVVYEALASSQDERAVLAKLAKAECF